MSDELMDNDLIARLEEACRSPSGDEMPGHAEPWGMDVALLREAIAALRASSAGVAPAGDRDVLLYLMQQFDAETWECPRCGHAEDTATMDSAEYLRSYLSAAPKPDEQTP